MNSVSRLPVPAARRLVGAAEVLPGIEDAPPLGTIGRSATFALAAILLALLAWISAIPLESAVVSQGDLVVETHRKTVQSREGGTVKALHVRDGDRVKAGDVLLEFDRVQAAANVEVYDTQYTRALAQQARLKAEMANASTITWPAELLDRQEESRIAEIMTIEQSFLVSRNREYSGEMSVNLRRIGELQERMRATGAQIVAVGQQLRLIEEEARDIGSLVAKGLARKPQLLALQRALAELTGRQGQLEAERAQLHQAMAGAEQEIENLELRRRSAIIEDLTNVEAAVAESYDRRISARDLLENTEVLAPEDGVVVNLRFFGPRAVVQSGEPILDIVPNEDELVVVSRVRPSDVDALYIGQPAEVRLKSFNQRDVHPVSGYVETISADSLTVQATGETYYEARVKLDQASLAEQPTIKLHPGMPADVVILTGERTVLDYLVSPIARYVYLSFREE